MREPTKAVSVYVVGVVVFLVDGVMSVVACVARIMSKIVI